MIMSVTLGPDERFKAPYCGECNSGNTYTQGTVQTPPWTVHKCKCRNCGNNFTVTSRVVKSTDVDGSN